MTRWYLLLALVLATAPSASAQFEQPKGYEDVVAIVVTLDPPSAKPGQTVAFKVSFDIVDGWHTYPMKQPDERVASTVTTIKLPRGVKPEQLPYVFVGEWSQPKSHTKKDEKGVPVEEIEGKAVWERKFVVRPNATPGEMTVRLLLISQVCKEQCLPIRNVPLEAKLTVLDGPPMPVDPQYVSEVDNGSTPPVPVAPPPPPPPPPPSVPPVGSADPTAPKPIPIDADTDVAAGNDWVLGQIVKTKVETPGGLMGLILQAMFWGAITLVTPCVFPMIPITVAFFLKQSEKRSSTLFLASIYCGTIVLVLGIAALTLLTTFRALSVNPYMNMFLGALFVFFAFSLFGMYEIVLPSSLAQFTSSREGGGGVLGTVFMALTFTIVSFTCVAPFLGGFGGMIGSQQYEYYELALAAFAFAATFAAPFFVLAVFPSLIKKLPRGGSWMARIKVVMGFLEISAALVFFRTAELRLLAKPEYFTYDVVLGAMVTLSLVCGLYLLGLFRLPHDDPEAHTSVPQMIFGLVFLGLALYLTPAMFRVGPDGQKQRPGGVVYAWVDSFLLPDPSESPGRLAWSGNLKRTVEVAREDRAKSGGRNLILVDFTGVTCKNCKLNEENVFPLAEVKEQMRKYRLVQMYTDTVPVELYATPVDKDRRDDDASANLRFQKEAFGTEQLPLYAILEALPDNTIAVRGVYTEGKINDANAFAAFLRKPMDEAPRR